MALRKYDIEPEDAAKVMFASYEYGAIFEAMKYSPKPEELSPKYVEAMAKFGIALETVCMKYVEPEILKMKDIDKGPRVDNITNQLWFWTVEDEIKQEKIDEAGSSESNAKSS